MASTALCSLARESAISVHVLAGGLALSRMVPSYLLSMRNLNTRAHQVVRCVRCICTIDCVQVPCTPKPLLGTVKSGEATLKRKAALQKGWPSRLKIP